MKVKLQYIPVKRLLEQEKMFGGTWFCPLRIDWIVGWLWFAIGQSHVSDILQQNMDVW